MSLPILEPYADEYVVGKGLLDRERRDKRCIPLGVVPVQTDKTANINTCKYTSELDLQQNRAGDNMRKESPSPYKGGNTIITPDHALKLIR